MQVVNMVAYHSYDLSRCQKKEVWINTDQKNLKSFQISCNSVAWITWQLKIVLIKTEAKRETWKEQNLRAVVCKSA